MNTLSTRLFAAFLVIILLVILIAGFMLVVVLRGSPIAERQTLARLGEAARLALRQHPPPNDPSPAAAEGYLDNLADVYNVRVLFTNANGRVLADSHAGTASPLNFQRFRDAQQESDAPGAFTGRARDEDRRLWLYAGRTDGARILVFASQPPRLAVLLFFGDNLLLPLLQAGTVATLLAVILAVLISRSIALPLQKMARVAGDVARGDYAQAARTEPIGGPEEVRALGRSLGQMARQVQASQQAQRDFLANISHDLKTPLTSIQGFAQAMLDGTAESPESVQRSAGIIHDEADRMRRLVDDLLDLARLDAGLRTLDRAPLDLSQALGAAVEKFGPRAREKGISLTSDLPASLPPVLGDADRLAQVFANLLDNALQHTPAGGQVSLSAAAEPGWVSVSVRDTGPGIAPEDLPRIFERFYQVDKSRARPGGVGLGLAITKEIVEAHGGRVTAKSRVGSGSVFTVRLPAGGPGASK